MGAMVEEAAYLIYAFFTIITANWINGPINAEAGIATNLTSQGWVFVSGTSNIIANTLKIIGQFITMIAA